MIVQSFFKKKGFPNICKVSIKIRELDVLMNDSKPRKFSCFHIVYAVVQGPIRFFTLYESFIIQDLKNLFTNVGKSEAYFLYIG